LKSKGTILRKNTGEIISENIIKNLRLEKKGQKTSLMPLKLLFNQ